MRLIKTSIYSAVLSVLLSSNVFADCTYELFSVSSVNNTKIIDFVNQLSDQCKFTIIVTDPQAKRTLNKRLNKTYLKNLTIDEVLNIILNENNLSYSLKDNILKISYITTKVFNINYILSQRKSTGSTDVTLSSATQGNSASPSQGSSNKNSNSQSGMKIESSDEVQFWTNLDTEFEKVLNRPQDTYKAEVPIINRNAGLVTVTATDRQMKRFAKYLARLQKKVQLQVLIDVQLLSVTMSNTKTTGIDWSQLYKLQNIRLTGSTAKYGNIGTTIPADGIVSDTSTTGTGVSRLLTMSASGSLLEVIKFLKTQGKVTSISNPKVLTLNNQPALITAGTEYFYKLTDTQTLASGTSGTQSANEKVNSVFAGVLLSITPEISDDNTVTLKINPSLSETTKDISGTDNSNRKMPPDLTRRQLSSVVTVKDGNRIILGGQINTHNTKDENKVPLLGDIPLFGYLFRHKSIVKTTEEIVIIIQPHIIHRDKNTLSLSELGYKGFDNKLTENNATK